MIDLYVRRKFFVGYGTGRDETQSRGTRAELPDLKLENPEFKSQNPENPGILKTGKKPERFFRVICRHL
jgi:hypothetical protein